MRLFGFQHVKELEWDKYKQKNPNLFSSGLDMIFYLSLCYIIPRTHFA